MGFLTLIVALLLEQVWPLHSNSLVHDAMRGLADFIERNFNAGERKQGVYGWLLLMLPLIVGVALVHVLLARAQISLALAWNVLIIYLTLGFRQFSHYYTDIQVALADNDLPEARRVLTEWKQLSDPKFNAADLGLPDIARLAIEEALVASHRHVFGVFFWFVVLPGPSGAVLYRVADYLARHWNQPERLRGEPFGQFAASIFGWIDFIPVRLTAVGFAIVGNFEDAAFCWRNHARQWADAARGILLASGAGALGVRLGDAQSFAAASTGTVVYIGTASSTSMVPVADQASPIEPDAETNAESMPGVEASTAALRSAVGLVWRSLVLWMILLLLLSVAGLFG